MNEARLCSWPRSAAELLMSVFPAAERASCLRLVLPAAAPMQANGFDLLSLEMLVGLHGLYEWTLLPLQMFSC